MFLARVSMLVHRERDIVLANPSVCLPLSVWPHLFRGAGHEKKEGRAVEVVHLVCKLEVFHVHSFQEQFIQPGWAECVFCVCAYLA